MRFRGLWGVVLVLLALACAVFGLVRANTAGRPAARPGGSGLESPPAHSSLSRRASRSPVGPSLSTLLSRPLPARDLYALADQLKLHPPRPISHVIHHSSPNYPVGHQDAFYVLQEDLNKYFVMHAAIRAKTPHLYLYVQNGMKVSQSAAQAAAQYFERSIYPNDRAFFGSEWRPGVDHDPHITCLVGNLRSISAAGFFSAEDEYPRLVNPWSNQREMIYINSTAVLPGDSYFNQIMAHEFQHMIHWHMHPRDNAWSNEGMSMLAEYLNHFPPQAEAQAFLSMPTTQLDTWTLNDQYTIPHYGGAYLFLRYLYDHYGRGVIREIVTDRKYTDLQLIDDALRRQHIHQTARGIFTDWVIANWLDDQSLGHGQYGYKDSSYKVSFHLTRSVPFKLSSSIPPWAAGYTQLNSVGKKSFQLQFSAPTSVPVVGFPHAGGGWWSNRGDMINTTLERTVDLRHVRRATLHFSTAYDIEKDYDYAYVEISRDSGKTWTTLRGTDTTTANPNGASYGNGYTGQSKGWKTESMNLSPYAGHRIKLRFQYITDDEYNGQSMVVKDITIPEIRFHDTFSGWQQRGFVPTMSGTLPATWTVQLISYTAHGVTVSRIPLSHDHGSVRIDPVKSGLKKVVVVVFSTAPRTTVQSKYTLTAR